MCINAKSLSSVEFEGLLRQKLPDLLRDHGEFRYEIMGIMADVFASKDDLKQVLEEIRKLREDSNRRFEEMNRTMNQRFEEMYRSQREVRLEVSALGGRIGYGLEEIIRQTVEEFSGQSFKKFEHLRLRDSEGEIYGVPADVEYDLYLEDSVNYVVEVKSHIKPGDVLIFHRKSLFAEKQLLKRIKPIMISASITKDAKEKCKELGIDLISRSVVD